MKTEIEDIFNLQSVVDNRNNSIHCFPKIPQMIQSPGSKSIVFCDLPGVFYQIYDIC